MPYLAQTATLRAPAHWIGLAAVAVSALTGVLDAGRKNMDLVGAVMVGSATALGGGTVRDVLLDRPVFWISDQTYLLVAFATTLIIFFAVRGLKLAPRLFLIPDAIGLALFTIAGIGFSGRALILLRRGWLPACLASLPGWWVACCAMCCATKCRSFSCAVSSMRRPPGPAR